MYETIGYTIGYALGLIISFIITGIFYCTAPIIIRIKAKAPVEKKCRATN